MPAPALLLGRREASEQACGFHSLRKGSPRLASPAVFVVTHLPAHASGQEEAVEAHEPVPCARVPSAGPRVPAGLAAPAPPRGSQKVKAGCAPRVGGTPCADPQTPLYGSTWRQFGKTALSEVLPRARTRRSICVTCPCRWKAEAEPISGPQGTRVGRAYGFFLG